MGVMRTVLHSLLTLVWGLWFGGLVTLFIAVIAIFQSFAPDRTLAGHAASQVFRAFNIYQLGLAAVALLTTFVWCFLQRGKLKLGLFLLFGLATFDACVITIHVASKLELLQQKQLTGTPEFARLHAYSMILYVAEVGLLLLAGLFLPWLRAAKEQS